MKIAKPQISLLLGAALVCTPAFTFGLQDNSAKQDMKDAGHETKNAAKDAGNGTKRGTEHAYNSTKRGTERGYHSTKNETRKGWHKTKNTTKGAVEGGKEGAKNPDDK